MLKKLAIIALAGIAGCSGLKKESKIELPKTLEESVKSSFRNSENMKRDQFRHPLETLRFFGVQNDMKVIEIQPGGGWYLEILAPFLAANGQYIMANAPLNPEVGYQVANAKKITDFFAKYPQTAKNVKEVSFDINNLNLGEKNSVDLILTFRNAHNWFKNKSAEKVFKEIYKTLKPGGVFGFVDHRENPNKYDASFKNGYVREREVIKLAESIGFKVAAKSEINGNPKDSRNHPHGVWSLPPGLRGGENEKQKYLDIGESDRMTIKFIKPKK